ncbi:MAG: response regulator transcription factor [Gammaproteobacteria bacterium]
MVEDEPGVRELLSALCESVGLAAEAYDSAESFLSAYRCEPIRARCLVLDYCLPGMNGLDLLKEMNAQGVRLPVLLLSGRAESGTVVEGLKLGIADFFPKPFEIEALSGRILELAGRKPENRSQPSSHGITINQGLSRGGGLPNAEGGPAVRHQPGGGSNIPRTARAKSSRR